MVEVKGAWWWGWRARTSKVVVVEAQYARLMELRGLMIMLFRSGRSQPGVLERNQVVRGFAGVTLVDFSLVTLPLSYDNHKSIFSLF